MAELSREAQEVLATLREAFRRYLTVKTDPETKRQSGEINVPRRQVSEAVILELQQSLKIVPATGGDLMIHYVAVPDAYGYARALLELWTARKVGRQVGNEIFHVLAAGRGLGLENLTNQMVFESLVRDERTFIEELWRVKPEA